MPEILCAIINLVIISLLIVLLLWILHIVRKKFTIVTSVFVYFLIGAIAFINQKYLIGDNYLDFYDGLGKVIDGYFNCLSVPFIYCYNLLANLILSICKLFTSDVEDIADFILNDVNIYYLISLQIIFVLLSAVIFKKKKRQCFETSRYRD